MVSMANQKNFINTVKKALEKPQAVSGSEADFFGGDISVESRAILEHIRNRGAADRKKLLDTLVEAAGPINLKVTPCDDVIAVTAAITALVREKDPEWGEQ